MKINQIKCDRCGRAADANQPDGISEAVIKLYRPDQETPPSVAKQLDLCEGCFRAVETAINSALAAGGLGVSPVVHAPRPQ